MIQPRLASSQTSSPNLRSPPLAKASHLHTELQHPTWSRPISPGNVVVPLEGRNSQSSAICKRRLASFSFSLGGSGTCCVFNMGISSEKRPPKIVFPLVCLWCPFGLHFCVPLASFDIPFRNTALTKLTDVPRAGTGHAVCTGPGLTLLVRSALGPGRTSMKPCPKNTN